MKRVISLMCFLSLTTICGFAKEGDAKLYAMLVTAATNRCTAYLESRANILSLGTNALPMLARYATDPTLKWQQRLVSRVCYERLVRGTDVDALRAYDWREDPGYRKKWENYVEGPSAKLGTIIVPKCRNIGLWYYYIELTWKETGELPVCDKCQKSFQKYADHREPNAEFTQRAEEGVKYCVHQDERFRKYWADWCLDAAIKEPENYWCQQIVSERMLTLPFSQWHVVKYRSLLKEKNPESLYVLVQCYDEFITNTSGIEMYPGAYAQGYRNDFIPILAFADSRHVNLLEKFISEKPTLAPLKARLAEVRARPAPPPQSEPPFRLGTNTVVIAQ